MCSHLPLPQTSPSNAIVWAELLPQPFFARRDLPAKGGWIWSKPELIDDDTKVAKRVAWLNKYGCLTKPIDWAEVADLLDSLKVAHAMVLLRELEMKGNKVADPTGFIKKAVEQAGGDEVDLAGTDSGQSAVAERIEELNSGGTLSAQIDATSVVDGLERLPEEDALGLLQEVADKGPSVKNPTAYIRFKLKARLAVLGVSLDDVSEHSKILKRVEWLNDYGGLLEDIEYNKVASALESVGSDAAMTILKQLEDQSAGIDNPTDFILRSTRQTNSRAGSGNSKPTKATPRDAPVAEAASARESTEPVTPLQALNDFMNFLNKGPGKRQNVKLAEVAGALEALGTKRACLDDPVSYIKAAAQRHGFTAVKAETAEPETAEDVDDVSRLTSRCKWLNQFAGLAQPISIDEVIGALYCLGVPQSMSILRGLQERGASVPDPTRYIKQAVQRANTAVSAEAEAEVILDPEDSSLHAPWVEEEIGCDGGFISTHLLEEEEIFDWPDESEQANWWDDEDLTADFAAAVGDENDEAWLDWSAAAAPAPKKPRTDASEAAAAAGRRAAARLAEKRDGPRRVVGSVTGYSQLVPSRATLKRSYEGLVKQEIREKQEPEEEDAVPSRDQLAGVAAVSKATLLPMSPQAVDEFGSFMILCLLASDASTLMEVKVQMLREDDAGCRAFFLYAASKHALYLDEQCSDLTTRIKALSRLPFYRAKDLIEEDGSGKASQTLPGVEQAWARRCHASESLVHWRLPTAVAEETVYRCQGIAMEMA
ncbi:unnamed protein product, partial [Symbiodinium sp. CCMP2456]